MREHVSVGLQLVNLDVEGKDMTMTEQDICDAIDILDKRIRQTGSTLGTHCAKGSALHKLQSAVRYLEALLRDSPEQFDSCNYA